jgi:hypothetical protein
LKRFLQRWAILDLRDRRFPLCAKFGHFFANIIIDMELESKKTFSVS